MNTHKVTYRSAIPVAGLLLILALSSCAIYRTASGVIAHKPYRMEHPVDHSLHASHGNQTVKLGYLEFDDQGEPWKRSVEGKERSQLPEVLSEIRKLTAQGPVSTIVFLHGWNHNASQANEKDGNLANFKRTLQEIAGASDHPVFGVYVSWRGADLGFPVYADVWSREGAAGRVGGPALAGALSAVSSASREHQGSRVIMVGHSFGGKILNQICCMQISTAIGRMAGKDELQVKPLADTILVVNSAVNGREMRHLQGMISEFNARYRNDKVQDVPLMISVASQTDIVTKHFMPIFQRFSRDVIGTDPAKSGHVSSRKQSDSLVQSMGFNRDFQTHEYREGEPVIMDADLLSKWKADTYRMSIIENLKMGRAYQNGNLTLRMLSPEEDIVRDSAVCRNPGNQTELSPCWFVQVPSHVIESHGGLWNPHFVGFISAIEGMNRNGTAKLHVKSP